MRLCPKIFFASLLLILLLDLPVQADTKYYQYNGNLPFIEMMLNMMVVMGMLDKVPPQMIGNGYGGQNYLTRQLLSNALLKNALLKQRDLSLSGMNPYGMHSTGLSPYGMNPVGLNPVSLNSLSLNPLLSGPWFGSPWNNAFRGGFPARSYINRPFIGDSFSNYPPSAMTLRRSPLSRYVRPFSPNNYNFGPPSPLAKLYRRQNIARYYGDSGFNDASPCVTEYCGLLPGSANAIARLNGVWVTDSGEMLGIKNRRFLWSDGKSRYLTGNIKVLPDTLVASVDGNKRVMRFGYRLRNNRLLTQDPDGLVRVFSRMSAERI